MIKLIITKEGIEERAFTQAEIEQRELDIITQEIEDAKPKPLTEIELLQEENSKLITRLYETEIATAETSSMQEQLIEVLIEMGVI